MADQYSVAGELCCGYFVTDSGQMNSPNVSNSGPDDLIVTCSWTIAAENKLIELQVMKMNMVNDKDYCDYRLSDYNIIEVLFDFSLTVRVAPHECVIRTGQP